MRIDCKTRSDILFHNQLYCCLVPRGMQHPWTHVDCKALACTSADIGRRARVGIEPVAAVQRHVHDPVQAALALNPRLCFRFDNWILTEAQQLSPGVMLQHVFCAC
jgi:hypothetical protein